MKKVFFYLLTLLFFILINSQFSVLQAQLTKNQIPDSAKFITTDIDNFWKAYDKFIIQNDTNVFNSDYINIGSTGLIDFLPFRIVGARYLASTVLKEKKNYDLVRDKTLLMNTIEKETRAGFQKLKVIYPEAIFPNVYFVIGRWNSGGTSSQNGIIIGTEVKANSLREMPYLINHELIHYQQNPTDTSSTLLAQCINEGAADFLGEMISGGTINEITYEYGYKNEAELKKIFAGDMNERDLKFWLYSYDDAKKLGYPPDLGYFIGYRICKSFYDNTNDKKQAISEILNIKDYNQFLKKSNYLDN